MTEVLRWADPPPIARLEQGEVHLWCACEDEAAPRLARIEPTLSEDEWAKARTLQVARERDRYVMWRRVLRDILARYLGVAASDIRFEYGEAGKPELATPTNAEQIRFSVTHSGELAVYAIARARRIGVDIERLRPFKEREKIAERFFAPSEWAALRMLPAVMRDEGFFNCWTRKEAFLKAIGVGVSYPLSSFAVTLRPGEPAAFVQLEANTAERAGWQLEHLAPARGYVGAFCVEAPIGVVRYYGWGS